jgi:hypothetical protein
MPEGTSVVNASAVDRALTDMRDGLAVLVIAGSNIDARRLFDQAAEKLNVDGEAGRWRDELITSPTGGRIYFRTYAGAVRCGAVRGLTLDSVYVDHSELERQVAPCFVTSPTGGEIVHC